MKIFKLPDLGEGLQDAEIVEWHVAVGDEVNVDQRLVSVETAKAVVEVPAPRGGCIAKLYGAPGDIIETGAPLVEYSDGDAPREDAGTVVGDVKVGDQVVNETPAAIGGVQVSAKATPAVRALAKRMDVDIAMVKPSGPDGLVTAADVKRAAAVLEEVGPLEALRGVRRAMARKMTQAHAEVAPVTIVDDADIEHWPREEDVTIRLARAIVSGCRAEPALNAWYDSQAVGRRVIDKIHIAVAVDTKEGLFVPVLRDVGNRSDDDLRRGLEKMKNDVLARSIPPEEMRGYTITLSNFGTMAGRYANPIVQPPSVAILGAGKIRPQVVVYNGAPAVHRVMPLSLTFDHRAVTGGEGARFLAAVIASLQD